MKKLANFTMTIIVIVTIFNFAEARAQTSKKVSQKETNDKEFEELRNQLIEKLDSDTIFTAYFNAMGEFANAQLKAVSCLETYNKESDKLFLLQKKSAFSKEVEEQLGVEKKALKDAEKELNIAEIKFNLAKKSYEANHKE